MASRPSDQDKTRLSLKDHPLLVFLSGILAAFLAGVGAYQFLEARIKAGIEDSVAARLKRVEEQLEVVGASAARANGRLDGIRLTVGAETFNEYGCGGEHRNPPDSLNVMVGLRDGTGCGVPNRNYYRPLSLSVPQK